MHPSRPLWRSRPLQWAAALLVALAALALLARLRPGPLPLDRGVHDWLVTHRTSSVTTFAKFATFTGSGILVYPMTVVVAALLWLRQGRVIALALLLTVFGGAAATGVLKVAVSRHRPAARDMLGTAEATLSFPSGHTASGCLLYIGAAMIATLTATVAVRVAAVGVATAWAATIAWSRLYLGFHWLSDIVASALLATAVLLICAYILRDVVVVSPGPPAVGTTPAPVESRTVGT
jgi:membrane-associated phospholipid phosphatase